ncbi:hypothetical protein VTO42DRAFT_5691 [Malbranchea cinnamomea]
MVPSIFPRAAQSCGDPTFVQCPGSSVPGDFCCPPASTCISLDNSSTVLCCRDGFNCGRIKPISCDLRYQDPTLDPSSLVKTTKLDVPLRRCGDACCPHGYDCLNDEKCVIDEKTSNYLPSLVSSSLSSTPTTTSTLLASSTTTSFILTEASTETSAAVSNTDLSTTIPVAFPGLTNDTETSVGGGPRITGAAVAVGFFPGLVAGLIIAAAWFFWRKYRSGKSSFSCWPKFADMRRRSNSSVHVSISDPIPISAQESVRTDFLRQQPLSRSTEDSRPRRSRTISRMRSFFSSSRAVEPDTSTMPPPPSTIHIHPVPSMESIHIHGSTSGESIPVYSPVERGYGGHYHPQPTLHPPDFPLRASRPPTTLTEMMERVGFHGFQTEQGSPYYRITDTPQPQAKQNKGSPLKPG